MQNVFIDEGNLGFDPSLKQVPVNTPRGVEQRSVVEMQVRFDYRKKKAGADEYEDIGGFWAKVALWGSRAEHVHKHLKKGARVLVVGEISQHPYVVQKGERKGQDATAIEVDASHIGLVLLGVDEITYQEKKSRSEMANDATQHEFVDESDNIPFDHEPS